MPGATGIGIFDGIADACTAAFGEAATLRRTTATPATAALRGIFDGRHYALEDGGEAPVSEYQVTFHCRRDAVEPVEAGDVLDARGVSWTIRDIRPDAEGWVVLALEQADAGT